ncbi:MAG: phosphatase PAP2 family protein [Chromatiales bacterium]|nr:phosphatase PAP2 family protein [Chromatiales bacterium]
MPTYDYLVMLVIAVFLIVGAYQFYFFPQRHPARQPREFRSRIDEAIPFRPGWVWIYSFLYYPAILVLVFLMASASQFIYTAFSFLVLMGMQLVFFFFFPVTTPKRWRDYELHTGWSVRFLRFVHSFDAQSNCFPSMHVSVATLTAHHMFQNLSEMFGLLAIAAYLFPALIGISTVYTKQHYLADVPAGVILGNVSYDAYLVLTG